MGMIVLLLTAGSGSRLISCAEIFFLWLQLLETILVFLSTCCMFMDLFIFCRTVDIVLDLDETLILFLCWIVDYKKIWKIFRVLVSVKSSYDFSYFSFPFGLHWRR